MMQWLDMLVAAVLLALFAVPGRRAWWDIFSGHCWRWG